MLSNKKQEVKKEYDRKSTRLLFIVSIILLAIDLAVSIIIHKTLKIHTFFVGTAVFINMTIYFTYGNAIKNSDFTIIAGFDNRIDYNITALKKMLYSSEKHIMLSSIIFISIFIFLGYSGLGKGIGNIFLLAYIGEFTTSVLFFTIKSQDDIFKNEEDLLMAKGSNIPIIIFLGLIFLLVGTMIFSFSIFNIENNSIEAIRIIGMTIPYIIISIFFLFMEQKNIKASIKKAQVYKISRTAYLSIAICILLLIGLVLVAKAK